jgi:prevent-host-death family protein
MKKVGVTKARLQLEELVEEVLRGRDVVITRWGKPVARILPYLPPNRRTGPPRGRNR